MEPLHPSIKTVWTIKFALLFTALLLAALTYDAVQYFGDADAFPPPPLLSVVVLVVGALITFLVPAFRYRFWRYALRTEELYLERGIFNRVRTIVPLRRIQHLDVSQDLLEREFDLGKLIVHTAGTRSSDVILPGLRMEQAEQLRDDVKRYLLEDTL